MIVTLATSYICFFFRRNNDDFEEEDLDSKRNDLLCRFVFDGIGRRIGESISLDEDILIIKSGKKYLGVPIKHIEEKEKTLVVKGLVDFAKAEELGEQWREGSFRNLEQEDEINEEEPGF